jgi:KDO2-lipid IV(A) lauroyltransferase
MGGLLLRAGLNAADLVARVLPRGAAYALADLVGRAWHRLAPRRRALVTANLARVSAVSGRPTQGPTMRRLVRRAFIEHARYYLEMLRIPHYSIEQIGEMVSADEWDRWEAVFRGGAVVATLHLGNFEPYGSFLAAHGLSAVVPVEEIRPRALYEFLVARRATGRGVEMVPLARARRPMIAALRRGGMVGIAADRDLGGDGQPLNLFGHAATLPTGPASLALMTGRPLVAAACWRIGPERFHARGWLIEVEPSGDRRADVAAMTDALARRFEEAISATPEQWWGCFQPIWPDLDRSQP